MAFEGRGNRGPDDGTWCCSRRRASFPEGLLERVGDGGAEVLEKALGMEVSVNGSKRLFDFTVEITVASACEGIDLVVVGIGGEGWRPCFPRWVEGEELLETVGKPNLLISDDEKMRFFLAQAYLGAVVALSLGCFACERPR